MESIMRLSQKGLDCTSPDAKKGWSVLSSRAVSRLRLEWGGGHSGDNFLYGLCFP